MFKKLILLCLALSLLLTCSVPALAVDPVEYYTAHSVEELVHWINTAEANKGEEWEAWYPFLHTARKHSELLVAAPAAEGYTLEEILVPAGQDNMQFFFKKDNSKFLVYIELPGTVDNPKPSLPERIATINRELALAYEDVQFTPIPDPFTGEATDTYYHDGGEYRIKGSDETELFAPTTYSDWLGYTIMRQGIGDLYGSKWDYTLFSPVQTKTVALNPIEFPGDDITEKFEDEAFRNFVYTAIGKTPGAPIYDTDVDHIWELDVHNSNDQPPVESLAGIEYFANLRRLDISLCQITELDVTMLKKLEHLSAYYCRNLKSLNATGLEYLKGLVCYDNALTELKVSSPSLIYIHCTDNQLPELDLSGCPALEDLYCVRNNLRTLDITPCPKLNDLSCYNNLFKDTSAIIGYDEDKWIEPLYSFDFNPQRFDIYETADTGWYHEEEASFTIGTAEQLIGLAQLVNNGTDFSGKTILLENSIDLSDYAENWNLGKGWTPIGQAGAAFKGHFDGNNKTIRGLYINDSNLDYAGLFGCVGGGSVKNLGLVNAVVKGKDQVGGIAGILYTDGWSSETHEYSDCAIMENCFVTGTVEGITSVGGIAGGLTYAYINDCYSGVAVTGNTNVGGIVGGADLCGVENCCSVGPVSGEKNVGGIVGNFAKGTLFTSYARGQISGSSFVGGIIGKNNLNNIVRQCVALNDSVSGTARVGRIAGYNLVDSQLQTNYALDSMVILKDDAQKETLANTHDQVDGADIGKEDVLSAAFWLDTMEYNPNVFTITDGDYPFLSKILEIGTDFYRVSFVDWDGRELKTLLVPHGSIAVTPSSPVREDHFFAGWDQDLGNVTEDMTVTATYRLSNPFADVSKNDWFYDGVCYSYERDWMKGISNDRFAPEDDVSRAMAITVLYRMAGSPSIELLWLTARPFQDISVNGWYYGAVLWGAGNGIVNGYDDRNFGPNDTVNREQLVTMFWRAQGKPVANAQVLSAYSDAAEISPWAKDAFAWAVSNDLIQGKPGNILDPKGVTSRAQLATILMRTNDIN